MLELVVKMKINYDMSQWRGTYSHDGGKTLSNQGIHHIDLLRYLGGEIDFVRLCTMRTLGPNKLKILRLHQ